MSTIIDSLEKEQLQQRPSFIAGDRVRVHFQVIEGTRARTQVFEGVVIKRQGSGVRETFTVRKQSFGVGVERTFPLHSPKIEQLEVAGRGDVRRAKLYYLRDRVGKAARVAERRWGIADAAEVLGAEADGAVDAEGATQVEAPQAMPAADGEEQLTEVPAAEVEEPQPAEEPRAAEDSGPERPDAAGARRPAEGDIGSESGAAESDDRAAESDEPAAGSDEQDSESDRDSEDDGNQDSGDDGKSEPTA